MAPPSCKTHFDICGKEGACGIDNGPMHHVRVGMIDRCMEHFWDGNPVAQVQSGWGILLKQRVVRCEVKPKLNPLCFTQK